MPPDAIERSARTTLPATPPNQAPPDQSDTLHGVVLRPPELRWDGQRTHGSLDLDTDLAAAASMPGVVRTVRSAAFVGLIAAHRSQAQQAADWLALRWRKKAAPADTPDVDTDISHSDHRTYRWHQPIDQYIEGTDVVAWCIDRRVAVWADRIDVAACRNELALLLALPPSAIDVHVMVDSSHHSANRLGATALPLNTDTSLACLDAATAAALLSRAVEQPVSVAITGADRIPTLTLRAPALPAVGPLSADRPWVERPSFARLLSQPDDAPPRPQTLRLAPQSSDPTHNVALPCSTQYAPLVCDASALTLAAAEVFARESLIDESLRAAGLDPLVERLAQTTDPRAHALLTQVIARAQTADVEAAAETAAAELPANPAELVNPVNPISPANPQGRGLAVAQIIDARDPRDVPAATVWTAWIADVTIDPTHGRIDVTRLTVGQDCGTLQPARSGVIVPDDTQRLLATRSLLGTIGRFDDWGVTLAPQRTTISEGQLAFDGVLSLPAAAAIANAVHDATGVRLRETPFNSQMLRRALADRKVRAGLALGAKDSNDATHGARNQIGHDTTARTDNPRRPGLWRWIAAGACAIGGAISLAWPLKSAIAPITRADLSVYSAAALERGRLVAIAGDCAVCHTAPGGPVNTGGLALDTPFGTIYSTNITPDIETGIGNWSFTAFDRAMRQGVHRDGRQLYPAFPYTAFAKLSEADMQGLYGYLMSQPAIAATPPPTRLAFPYNQRALMAGWNLLFHDDRPFRPDPTRSPEWNRGAYLVQGAGHCGACHSPRNALGAERTDPASLLTGGNVENWQAPALNTLASASVPWSADDLFTYLRTGFSARHGVAAGPMAPVVHGLAQLPDSDVRAIVTYLMALSPDAQTLGPPIIGPQGLDTQAIGAEVIAATPSPSHALAKADTLFGGERIYQNACSVCHEPGQGPTLFGVKPSLALNTNLHSESPDNLIQVILHGIQEPANGDLGYMPGFQDSLDDRQIGELIAYLRARFAPTQPAWSSVDERITRLRLVPGED